MIVQSNLCTAWTSAIAMLHWWTICPFSLQRDWPMIFITSSDQLYDCPRATDHGTKRNLKKPPKILPSQSRPSQLCNLLCWLCGHPQKLVTPNQVCENQWKPTRVAHVDVAETNKVWSNQWKPFEQMHLCSQISGNWPSQQVLTLQSNACTDCSNWW